MKTTLRNTFAYHAYQKGIPIPVIQKYLGHQSAIVNTDELVERSRQHSIYIPLEL